MIEMTKKKQQRNVNDSSNGSTSNTYLKLASQLDNCQQYHPKVWKKLYEGASLLDQNVIKTIDTNTIGHASKRLKASGSSEDEILTNRPSSRDESPPPVVFPKIHPGSTSSTTPSLAQYLCQPDLIDQILKEEGLYEEKSKIKEQQERAVKEIFEHDFEVHEQGELSKTPRTGDANGNDAVLGKKTSISPPKLPILKTMSPRTRDGLARLPNPSEQELATIEQLEHLADIDPEGAKKRLFYKSLKKHLKKSHHQHQSYADVVQSQRQGQQLQEQLEKQKSSMRKTSCFFQAPRKISIIRVNQPLVEELEQVKEEQGSVHDVSSTVEASAPSPKGSESALIEDFDLKRPPYARSAFSLDESQHEDQQHHDENGDEEENEDEVGSIASIQSNHSLAPYKYHDLSNIQQYKQLKRRSTVELHRLRQSHIELSQVLAAVSNQEYTTQKALDNTLTEVKKWIPLEVIYQHGKGIFASPAQQRAAELLFKVGVRLTQAQQLGGFERWKKQTQLAREREQHASALTLQCWWRQLLAIKEANIRRHVRMEISKRQQISLRILNQRKERSSIIITRNVRRFSTQQRRIARIEREQAALVIQNFWRSLKAKWQAMVLYLFRKRRKYAAIKIQTQWRGFLARRKRRLLKKIRQVENKMNQKIQKQQQRLEKFQLIAATMRVQRIYRMMQIRKRERYQKMRQRFENEKKNALQIQRVYRGFCGRQEAKKKRQQLDSVTRKIQQNWRQYIARFKVKTRKNDRKQTIQQQRQRQRQRQQQWNMRTSTPGTTNGSSSSTNLQPDSADTGGGAARGAKTLSSWITRTAAMTTVMSTLSPEQRQRREQEAASRIQAGWKGFRTRKRLRYEKAKKRQEKERQVVQKIKQAAICIQAHVRGMLGRSKAWEKLVSKSCMTLQRVWRGYRARKQLKELFLTVKAIETLQRRWRERKAKEKFQARDRSSRMIQQIVRRFLCRKMIFKRIQRMERLEELNFVGHRLFEKSIEHVKNELLLLSFQATFDTEMKHVMQALYTLDKHHGHGSKKWKTKGCQGLWQKIYLNITKNDKSIPRQGSHGDKDDEDDEDTTIKKADHDKEDGYALEIDNSRFARFLKEIPGIVTKNGPFTIQSIDVIFAKMKEPKARTIDFRRFTKAMIQVLAEKFPQITKYPPLPSSLSLSSSSRSTNPSSRTPTDTDTDTHTGPLPQEANTLSSSFQASSSVPELIPMIQYEQKDQARFLHFMHQHLLTSTRIHHGKYRTKINKLVMDRMKWAVKIIQRCARQQERQRQHMRFLYFYRQKQRHALEQKSARILQKWYRRLRFHRQMQRHIQENFVEFIDHKGKSAYYQSKITKKIFTRKPKLLHGLPCGTTIPLGKPGEEFVALCDRHENGSVQIYGKEQVDKKSHRVLAAWYCVQCEDAMCHACYDREHQRRALKSHQRLAIVKCSYCGLQHATKECHQCGNGKVPFCDACFPYFHTKVLPKRFEQQLRDEQIRSIISQQQHEQEQAQHLQQLQSTATGSTVTTRPAHAATTITESTSSTTQDAAMSIEMEAMRLADAHTFHALVVMCIECNSRVAQWYCSTCNDMYCKSCLTTLHFRGKRQEHSFIRLSYFSVLASQAQGKREKDRQLKLEKMEKQKEEEAKANLEREQVEQKNAAIIQSWFRSCRERFQGKQYMKMVRQTQVAIAQRQKDAKIRTSFKYRVQTVFGRAPMLKSDTKQEKEAKLKRQEMFSLKARRNKTDERILTEKQCIHLQVLAKKWIKYNTQVKVIHSRHSSKKEYINQIGIILSTQTLLLNGKVLVFMPQANKAIAFDVINQEIQPWDQKAFELDQRQPIESWYMKLYHLSHDLNIKAYGLIETAMLYAKWLYFQRIEFQDVVAYAWVVELNKHENKLEYWNVVLNKRVSIQPKSLEQLERMDEEERKKIDERVALAKKKLIDFLYPLKNKRSRPIQFDPTKRRGAIDLTGKTSQSDVNVHAMSCAKFWQEQIVPNENFGGQKAMRLLTDSHVTTMDMWLLAQLVQLVKEAATEAEDVEESYKNYILGVTKFMSFPPEEQIYLLHEIAPLLKKLNDDPEAKENTLKKYAQYIQVSEETRHLIIFNANQQKQKQA